ncbi:MAG: transcriptional regulator NrdR [Bacillota bacterium]|uniref:Transcriptional repressor NrdR n=1 Tax=Thermanaerosceptrum fracticalcis TaxID=1712410 RepID=A0A7G6DZ55_THEFR|nr:transcriptional regulator NrdR [Thermanaerosceptrum fracticalcis]QNB45109.1 transcriptional repressor NrdR [Thermanaerosceptrum fracticalcis]
MRCPYCGQGDSRVLETRLADDGYSVRRRRECPDCLNRFTTYEKIDDLPLLVIKKDGRREVFDQRKILNGLIKACEKRPVPLDKLEKLAAGIERSLKDSSLKREVASSEIGELVMERLKQLDEVAYVRFASVYREFKDISTFFTEIERLLRKE